MLSESQVNKFQDIYQKKFGRPISRQDAMDKGIKLVRLMELTYKPMTILDQQRVKNRVLELQA